MKITTQSLRGSILGAATALLMPFLAAAVINTGPSGSFTNTVTGPSNAVWDFGGLITNVDVSITNDNVDVRFPVTIQQSGAGKISGAGTNVDVALQTAGGSTHFLGNYKASGSVNSTAKGTHLLFTATVSGNTSVPGQGSTVRRASATFQVNGLINNTNQTISGQMKNLASASGLPSASEIDDFGPSPLTDISSDLGDGGWTLILSNLATTNNAVTGTATITLDSEQSFNYSVKGSFNSTKGTKLVLTGSDATSKGSAIQVMLDTNNVVRNVKGRISGQMVNANF
jgi:hypothetical protein